MRKPRQSKRKTVEQLIQLFKQRGYDGASLSELSAATGLGRASLYHHFPGGKEEMGKAALAQSGQGFAAHLLAPLTTKTPPRQRLLTMLDGVERYYADEPLACLTNSMILGSEDNPFRAMVKASLTAWIARMAEAWREAGVANARAQAQAEHMAVTIQGALIMGRVLEDREVLRRTLERLRREIKNF